MMDRRHYPRLAANVLWRSAGLRAPRRPAVDASLSGMRVYSDEMVPVGARLELEILVPGETAIEIFARVVRVGMLPPSGPAFCDVALEFLNIPGEARDRLAGCLHAAHLPPPPSQPRVDEQHCDEIG